MNTPKPCDSCLHLYYDALQKDNPSYKAECKKGMKMKPGCKEYKHYNWVSFYFEGNLAWGEINTPEEWERIKKAYKDTSVNLYYAKNNPKNTKPCFGLYSEYNGNENLGEFAEQHGMNIGYYKKEI